MNSWRQVLRENDPGLERMDADAAARLREVVVRAARTSAPLRAVWPMRVALAAFGCVVLMMSIVGTQRPVDVTAGGIAPVAGAGRRQIQFATPGGTRIIWELNPKFSLTETLP